MSATDDMLSNISSTSTMLSFQGESVDAEKAVDSAISQIQQGLNEVNVQMRNMLAGDEREDEYEDIIPYANNINTIAREFKDLIKEILSITKQLTPKKPKDYVAPASTAQTTK